MRLTQRSVSQIDSFNNNCGMQYRLQRVDRVSARPMWGSVGGTVAHEIVNAYERARARGDLGITSDRAAALFAAGLRLKVDEIRETTPFAPELWYASNSGREDRAWWEDNGPQFVAMYIDAQADRTAETLEHNGVLMLEADLRGQAGNVEIRGIVDHVLSHATGAITIRDFKFGRQAPPSGALQLDTYPVLLMQAGVFGEDKPGPEIWTDYWIGRKGSATKARRVDLRAAYERLTYEATIMDVSERAGLYVPRPSALCVSCGVRRACPVLGDDDERRPLVLPEMPNSRLLTGVPMASNVLDVQQRDGT